ncbi:class I SAM-dependent methyltransferase, partial [Sulfurospirillum sp.]|nr:class I SAM-dependent methyltransferase [Sulfurospirillum sp.]
MEQSVKELHVKRVKMWDESIANHAKYIDEKSGFFQDKWVEHRTCPVCEKNNYIKIFEKEGGQYVKCLDCSMVYANPVFTNDALTDYYQNNHTEQSEVVESDTDNFYVNLYNKGLDSIEKNSKTGNILDIGCSSGIFLDTAKKRDWNTNGVELNRKEFELAQKKGHKAYNELLENIIFEEKFDAISMWDVFEHIRDGKDYLNQMKNLLSHSGVIFLQIPSSDSLAAKILQEKCNMFDGLEHVNLYGVKTIELLAKKCGLKVLSLN